MTDAPKVSRNAMFVRRDSGHNQTMRHNVELMTGQTYSIATCQDCEWQTLTTGANHEADALDAARRHAR